MGKYYPLLKKYKENQDMNVKPKEEGYLGKVWKPFYNFQLCLTHVATGIRLVSILFPKKSHNHDCWHSVKCFTSFVIWTFFQVGYRRCGLLCQVPSGCQGPSSQGHCLHLYPGTCPNCTGIKKLCKYQIFCVSDSRQYCVKKSSTHFPLIYVSRTADSSFFLSVQLTDICAPSSKAS